MREFTNIELKVLLACIRFAQAEMYKNSNHQMTDHLKFIDEHRHCLFSAQSKIGEGMKETENV